MGEAFEDEGDDEARPAGLAAGEVTSIEQDWDVVTAMLPAQWQTKAVELGAVRRLRGFGSVEALLRVLLIHLADGCSLRETVVRARAGDFARRQLARPHLVGIFVFERLVHDNPRRSTMRQSIA